MGNEKKMKMEEMVEMQRQSREEYYVITSDMVALDEHIVKA